MSKITKIVIAGAGLLALAACSEEMVSTETGPAQGVPVAGSSTDVTDFEGAPAGQAEGGLRGLGYEPVRSQGLTTYWFNRDTGACAEITTSEGRYSSVTMVPAEDC